MASNLKDLEFFNYGIKDMCISGVFEDGTTTGMVFLHSDEADGVLGAISDSESSDAFLASSSFLCNRVISFIELNEFIERMQQAYNAERIMPFIDKYFETGVKKIRVSAPYLTNSRVDNKF